jgi:hypothetical protein
VTDIVVQPLTVANQADLNRCDNSFTCRDVMPGTRKIALFWYLLFQR